MVQMDASFLVCTDTAPASEITDTDGAEGSNEPVPAVSVGMVLVVRTWPPDSMFGSAVICQMLRITIRNLVCHVILPQLELRDAQRANDPPIPPLPHTHTHTHARTMHAQTYTLLSIKV